MARTLLQAHADTLQQSGRLRALFLSIGRQGGRRLSTRERNQEAHTGLVSELLAGLSPAPLMWLYSSGHTETRNSHSIRGVFDESVDDEKVSRRIQRTCG